MNDSASGTQPPLPHERLQAFVACRELTLAVYQTILPWASADGTFPILAEEARTSARRAQLKIREGAELPPRGFRRCLDEAVGKLARLSAALTIARDVGLLSQQQFTDLEIRRDHAERLTRGLRRSIGKRGGRPSRLRSNLVNGD